MAESIDWQTDVRLADAGPIQAVGLFDAGGIKGLVAATEIGVCGLFLDPSITNLWQALLARFSSALTPTFQSVDLIELSDLLADLSNEFILVGDCSASEPISQHLRLPEIAKIVRRSLGAAHVGVQPVGVQPSGCQAPPVNVGVQPLGCQAQPLTPTNIPLHLWGTSFQQRVWQELLQIPFGTTITYRQLAARIGQETAVRAVASACGANPVAILVPCHRVIASDGALAGYRWGSEIKKQLIDFENGQISLVPAEVVNT